jgi:hypothetical protein
MTRPPAILCLDRHPTDADARRLRSGSRIAGLTAALAGAPGTAVGVVASDAQLVAAVEAARRGWDLVIRLELHGEPRRLALEDFARVGTLVEEGRLAHCPLLDPVDAELLDQLAAGSTVGAAARAVGVSDRTAARRLACLRAALDVATTEGLLARWRAHRAIGARRDEETKGVPGETPLRPLVLPRPADAAVHGTWGKSGS